jgi:hypothetical protein
MRRAILLAALSLLSAYATAAPEEYQLKAVFLFNFAQFVDWPAQDARNPQSPFVIGVFGTDPFGSQLDEVVRSETVGGRALVVKRYQKPDEIGDCHILFLGNVPPDSLEQLQQISQQRHILTVSDLDTVAKPGAMIQFMTERNRIRLRINVESARAAGLTISSKLLRPAQLVN